MDCVSWWFTLGIRDWFVSFFFFFYHIGLFWLLVLCVFFVFYDIYIYIWTNSNRIMNHKYHVTLRYFN